MSAIVNLREWLTWHYLQGTGGAPLWESIGEQADEAAAWLRQALRTHFPSTAPVDALDQLLFNRNLDPPAGSMGTDAVRTYLADPWSKWAKAGTRVRLQEELALLGYTSTQIVSYADLRSAGFPPSVFGGLTSFWYLIVKKPNPWQPPGKWGADGAWGGGAKWGSTATWQEIQAIRRVIAKWKPAASSCRFIEAWLQVSLFGLPTRIVRWPVHEDWEQSPGGGYPNFYNTSF